MSSIPTFTEPHVRPLARTSAELDAFRFPGEAARAVISGSAGSGKTTMLHRLALLLEDEGTDTIWLREGTDVDEIPAEAVLLVDDAQLLTDDRLIALAHRAEDPDAGLLVAARTWPAGPQLGALVLALERSHRTILLGDVTRHGLREEAGDELDGRCEEAVLQLTGGITWLVHGCLDMHDADDCRNDPAHRTLRDALRPRILHRLMSVRPALRSLVDDLSLGLSSATDAATRPDDVDALLWEGYAEGLLMDDGHPAPVIADAVRAVAPVTRMIHIIRSASATELHDERLLRSLDGVKDARIADALAARAPELLPQDPALANTLFDLALACGAEPDLLAEDRAYAAWALGRLDEAGVLLDTRLAAAPPTSVGRLSDLSAAVWADRGMMQLADDTYRSVRACGIGAQTRARLAALGAGRVEGAEAASEPSQAASPSTLRTAYELWDRGLTATLSTAAEATALPDLQRASELYTASADAGPAVELPAVIAAAAAIGLGDLKTAQTIVDDALHAQQGGPHRTARLSLWSAWIALQREHPADARAALDRATESGVLSPRDDAFAATITIGLARRYDDAAGLAAAWEASRARITRTEPDLYTLLPLGELVIAAARLGDADRMRVPFERALRLVADLGEPAAWSAPLHWAGIQRGILLNQPEALAPHARALVAAAPHNRLAARMAGAGRVWTSVLAGTVDPDAVEAAARGLATVGLAWDGARLAGHGAGRSEDRRVIARLLACARELHPRDNARSADPAGDGNETPEAVTDGLLSEREREVAELVLQGKTYAEIGAAIFISPRTAEHHIAHIRRRLDATSRSDLLSKLRIALEDAPALAGSPGREAAGA
ncbi:LuxR C-terminal-related transcriptional regulator [Microbacterium allomyrinae]|uniref:LuxR family transcriptional regulator n=1 Tax=Microbacterium allomyrinae TaxID=2830666 RepID=A0A9X1LZL6_9MICO|nr:LuxR C-terminal-related transcriptional regulator [Microbacterium allomyrinae]MCC2034100.1 LuxR family transcriptional regulator [Microbacterium allomyrinae]